MLTSSSSRHDKQSLLLAAVTFDLHSHDAPEDWDVSRDTLARLGIRGTFFMPTSLLAQRRYDAPLSALVAAGHEVGSHGHRHDPYEIRALREGRAASIGFLALSRDLLGERLGRAPRSFRSPCWCGVGPHALDELARLGYEVDASATPQRLGLLSSYPRHNPWILAARRPTLPRPGLMEIPTSSFLIPLGSPTLATLRSGSRAFLRMLEAEARLSGSVLNIQLHPEDLVDTPRRKLGPFSLRHLLPFPGDGIRARWYLRTNDASVIRRAALGLLEDVRRHRCLPLSEVRGELLRARDGRDRATGGATTVAPSAIDPEA